MKTNFISALFFLVTEFLGFSAYAQDSSFSASIVRWDLASAIAYAKQNNIQVNIVRLDEKLSEQDLLLARAARYPNLSGAATQSLTHSGNTNPVIGGFQTQSNLVENYSVNSAWTVYRGGYLNSDVKSLRATRRCVVNSHFQQSDYKTNVERSKILIDQARLTLEQTRTTLNQQIRASL